MSGKRDVARSFCIKQKDRANGNFRSTGTHAYSYNLLIAKWTGEDSIELFNGPASKTTTIHMSAIRMAAAHQNLKVTETSDDLEE